MGSGVSAYKGTDGSEADACEAALMEALKLRGGLKRSSTVGLSGELGSLLLNRDVLRAGGTRAGSGSAYSQKRRRQMLSRLRSSRVLAEALSEKRAGRALCGREEAPLKRVPGLGDDAASERRWPRAADRSTSSAARGWPAAPADEEHAGAPRGGETTSMQIFVAARTRPSP